MFKFWIYDVIYHKEKGEFFFFNLIGGINYIVELLLLRRYYFFNIIAGFHLGGIFMRMNWVTSSFKFLFTVIK